MNKVMAFLISGYIGGVIGQFIYLNFFHPLAKLKGAMFNLGMSLVWSIGKISPPWWVWLLAIIFAVFAVLGDANSTNNK